MTLQPNDIDYMTEAKAAITQRTPRGGRLLLWVIVVFFVSITFWAANAPIDEVTRGEGKVIPSQQVQVVQNFEGGILSEIFSLCFVIAVTTRAFKSFLSGLTQKILSFLSR